MAAEAARGEQNVKEAYYFSHDANARHDPKITAMRSVYGAEGYGWYWIIVEMLREANDYKLDMRSKYVFHAFASQMQCDASKAQEFINDCISEFELFASDGTHFWSESLCRRMREREEKSEKARQSANARWSRKPASNKDFSPNESDSHSDRNANASKNDALKESKRKEIKRKESNHNTPLISPQGERTRFTPPTLEEVVAYCEERKNNVDAAKWYDFYASKGWMVGRNKMKDWKAAVRTWERGEQSSFKPQRKETSFDVLQRMIRESEGHGSRGRVEVNHDLFG